MQRTPTARVLDPLWAVTVPQAEQSKAQIMDPPAVAIAPDGRTSALKATPPRAGSELVLTAAVAALHPLRVRARQRRCPSISRGRVDGVTVRFVDAAP